MREAYTHFLVTHMYHSIYVELESHSLSIILVTLDEKDT